MEGTFKARAIDYQLGVSNNGNEQVAVMFEIIGGEHNGEKRSWFGSFTDKTVDRTLDSLRHCGWAGDDITQLDDITKNEVEIVIEEEQAQDENRNPRFDANGNPVIRERVKWVNKPRALALKNQLTPAQAAAFANRLKGKAVAHRNAYGAGQPRQASSGMPGGQPKRSPSAGFDSSAPMPEDDDIPF